MSDTILISIGMILLIAAVIAVIVVVGRRAANASRKGLTGEVMRLAKGGNLTIDKIKVFHKRAIAISKSSRRLLYVTSYDDILKSDDIDLDSITACEIVSVGFKRVGGSNAGSTDQNTPEIRLQLLAGKLVVLSPAFYVEAEDGVLAFMECKELAQEWKGEIASLMLNRAGVVG
jgi:hypothetical protein